jgi:hypothetical protein
VLRIVEGKIDNDNLGKEYYEFTLTLPEEEMTVVCQFLCNYPSGGLVTRATLPVFVECFRFEFRKGLSAQ